MNIRNLYDRLPDTDAFLAIETQSAALPHILPEYTPMEEKCICIYGLSEEALDNFLIKVQAKAESYARIMKNTLGDGALWDICCKPILLFECKEGAEVFKDYANSLDGEAFCDFVSELQLRFNRPWTHVRMIRRGEEREIIGRWERGSFND